MKAISIRRLLVVATLLSLTLMIGFSAHTVHASGSLNKVLILDSTVTGGSSSLEAQAAMSLGMGVDVVSGAQWDAMTTDQFKQYKAIVLGDPTCTAPADPSLAPAESNVSTWSRAIGGKMIIIGTDPVFHATYGFNSSGAMALIQAGIKQVVNYPYTPYATGAYIDLSCYYAGATPGTPVPVLSAFGSFTVEGQGYLTDTETADVTSTPPRALKSVTSANLSGWENSIHEAFTSYPTSGFKVFASSDNAGVPGTPYILYRGD